MASNPFDRYDAMAMQDKSASGNPFDKFDAPAEEPNVYADVAKSAGIGLVKGAIGLGSMPGNLEHLARMGVDAAARGLGYADPKTSEGWLLPHYGHYVADLERRLGTELYKPKTTAGHVVDTVAQFVPGAAALPGTIAQKAIGGVVGPVIGSELAGAATEGTALEPWAKAAGAIIGSKAAPMVADATKAVGKAVAAPVRAVVNEKGFAAEKAGERLAQDLTVPGTNPTTADIIARANQRLDSMGTPSARVADIGSENTQGLLRSAFNMPNDYAKTGKQILDTRQGNQWARIEKSAEKGLAPGRMAEQTIDDIIAARDAAADPAFRLARSIPTPLTQELTGVLNRPTMQKVGQKVALRLEDEGKTLSPANNTEWLHRVKLELDDLIGQSKLAEKMGNTPQAGFDTKTLVTLKNDLLNSIKHPQYKAALNQFAGPSALKTAVERGMDEFFTSSPYQLAAAMRKMTASEQEMYRLGVKQAIFQKLERPNVNRDLTDGVFGSAGIQKQLRAVFPDQKQFREFQKSLIAEAKMADTRKAAQGNSTTAKQLASAAEQGKNVQLGLNTAAAVASGRLDRIAHSAANVYNRFSGLTPGVAAEVLKLYLARDPRAALAQMQGGLERATVSPIRQPGFMPGLMSAGSTAPIGLLEDMPPNVRR